MKTILLFFSVFLLLLHIDTIHADYTVEMADYIEQWKFECHYLNRTQRVKYLGRVFYNQEEIVYFDSDVGYFIAKTELGRSAADQYNKDEAFLEQQRAAVQTFCIHNYETAENVGIQGRRVSPSIKVSLMPDYEDSNSEHHMLVCNVFGFYPSEIEVKWYLNGQEETAQVQSTETFQNGDWTFQILVILETEIKKGDTFTCEVIHDSLEAPLKVDWTSQTSDSATSKVATGIVGFVLGTVLIIAGVVYYLRSRKAQALFRGPQAEHFIHT